MIVMILEKTPASLKGELSRWLFEVRTGVYMGHVNAMVRDKLWEKCTRARGSGCVFQAWSTNNEQRFQMRQHGTEKSSVVDFEGLAFIRENGDPLSMVQKRRMENG